MNTPKGLKQELIEALKEAAAVLAGEAPPRVPLADELEGFAYMLADTPTPPEQPAARKCRKCGGDMRQGKAIAQTFNCRDEGTCSPGGPGKMIDCLKCSACGWSVTLGKQPAPTDADRSDAWDAAWDAVLVETRSLPTYAATIVEVKSSNHAGGDASDATRGAAGGSAAFLGASEGAFVPCTGGDAAPLEQPASTPLEQLISRLEEMSRNGHEWLTIPAVLAMIGTCASAAPQPAAQGELTDERIIDIKKASRCADPTKQWGDTLVFARAVIAAHDAARAPEIMEAVKLALSNKLSIHEVERLVRGEKA